MFTGLVLIALFALFMAIAVKQDNAQEALYLESPEVNDIYTVNLTKIFPEAEFQYRYGLLKVKSTSVTDVEFLVSKIAYNKMKGTSRDIRNGKAANDDYYEVETLRLQFHDLQHLEEKGAIYGIDRHY